jgi:MFS family permease
VVAVVRAEPRFARLLGSSLLSGIGTQINRVGVLAVVYQTTESSLIVSLSIAVRMGAVVLTGPLAAYVADRYPRKTVMIACDLVCALAAALLIFTTSRSALLALLALIGALEALSGLFSAARSATIPNIVAEEHVAAANSLDQGVFGLVTASGSLLGGVLVANFGSQTVFVINAATFLMSAALLLGIAVPATAKDNAADAGLRPAVRAIRSDRSLRFAIALTAVWPLAGGVLSVLITIYAYQTFHSAQFGVGLLYGALGLGYLAGGLLARMLLADACRRTVTQAACCYAIEGLFYAVTSQTPSVWAAAGLLALGTTFAAVGNAATASVIMTHTPDGVRGRVFGTSQTFNSASQIVAMLSAGLILEVVSARPVGLVSGLLLTALCTIMLLVYRRATAPASRMSGRIGIKGGSRR